MEARASLRASMNPTILIVDDEKHTRDGLRASLEDSFDVYVAADIGGALGVLERETVDLVLTDLRLGGEDGMTLIDKLLALPHPPVAKGQSFGKPLFETGLMPGTVAAFNSLRLP